jgi:enterochelin esterase-like enzyme
MSVLQEEDAGMTVPGLTSHTLFVVVAVAAVLPLLGVAWLAWGVSVAARDRPLTRRVLPAVALVLCAQLFAMAAFALRVNDEYLFYTSWADLTGQITQTSPIQTGGLVGHGQGHVQVMTVPARDTGSQHQVLVWLPPQYDLAAYRNHRFPVVMFLTGQPSTPQTAFSRFHFARTAMRLIDANRTQPFIGVFPTLMISPPRDTECTNVPGGPRAETWLARDVPRFTEQHFRVARPGQAWTTMGWSTGGFCAAKLVASHPALFGSAVSLGGYYQPLQDGTTGSLFGGRKRLALYNSPEWLYLHHGGLRGSRLLVVTGRQDRDTWRSTHQMIQTTAGDPAVAHIIFPRGGHNYRNYAAYLAPSLAWGASRWPTSSGQ